MDNNETTTETPPTTPTDMGVVLPPEQEPSKPNPDKWIKIVTVVLTLGLVGGAAWFFVVRNNKTTAPVNKEQKDVSNQTMPQTPIPRALFEASGNQRGGITVGYVKKADKAVTSYFGSSQKVYAAENQYDTTVFFIKQGKLYSYNVETLEQKEISSTDEAGVGTPVFSTVSQSIAYETSNGIVIKSLSDPTLKDIIRSENSSVNKPIAWSPDGMKLLFASDNTDPSQFGILGLNKYSLADKKTASINPPDGYNSLTFFSNIKWETANTVLVEFADKVEFGQFKTRKWFSINAADGTSTARSDINFEDLNSVQFTPTNVYQLTNDMPPMLQVSPIDNLNDKQKINGTEGISANYLVAEDPVSQQATRIIVSEGQPGSENSFTFKSVSVNDGASQILHKPSGFSAYLIGWNSDYSSFLYLSYLSGKSEIHEYDLIQKSDRLVVGELDFIQ